MQNKKPSGGGIYQVPTHQSSVFKRLDSTDKIKSSLIRNQSPLGFSVSQSSLHSSASKLPSLPKLTIHKSASKPY
jgi:hypothetical protein